MESKTKKIRVRELRDWPPGPAGAINPGENLPNRGEAVVTELMRLDETRIMFKGEFKGSANSYHYKAENKKIASQIQTIIGANIGKTVAQLGEFEIDVEC